MKHEETTTHTPGPWYVRSGPPNGVAVHWSEDGQICPLRWTDGLHADVEARVLADAHLIAAAPALLNAAKHLLSLAAHGHTTLASCEACVAAAHAIAKAEGR